MNGERNDGKGRTCVNPGTTEARRVTRERQAAFDAALNERALAQLYAEFTTEDRDLANAGLSEYARSLAEEDREDREE